MNEGSDVDKLLFPVKLGPQVLVMLGGLGACGVLGSCGYHSVHSAPTASRLSVVAGIHSVPDVAAVQAVMVGARSELAKAGALQAGAAYPQLVIEILRVDEQALGIAATPRAGGDVPLARGTSIAVVGRARLVESPGGVAARDSGDLRRVERFAASSNRHAEAAVRQ